MWFWRGNKPQPEPETCAERVSKLEKRLTRMEAELLDLATAQDIIRDKVLRKIQIKREPTETTETKDLYNGVLIPEKG